MSTYKVHAKRWSGGWELHVDGIGVTQVRLLSDAEAQVRDLIETVTDVPVPNDAVIHVDAPELGSLLDEAVQARQMTADAARRQLEAAELTRRIVTGLRDANLSVTEIAGVLGVSRGRVSQLVKH